MILNGTINYLQLREHNKFQKLVNVLPPSSSDDKSGSSDSDKQVEEKVLESKTSRSAETAELAATV
jgi:hypothetical protein